MPTKPSPTKAGRFGQGHLGRTSPDEVDAGIRTALAAEISSLLSATLLLGDSDGDAWRVRPLPAVADPG